MTASVQAARIAKGETDLSATKPATRRRNSAEDTRLRILDVVVQTVLEIGYYKASSNEIARRAGVTWGTIQHLFGSRDQLMLDVVNYVGAKMEEQTAAASIGGATLEERLDSILDVLATSYDQVYLVQMQILLELSANPRMSALVERGIDRGEGTDFDRLAQPLLVKAIGGVAADPDLVKYVFLTFRGFLISIAFSQRIAKLPAGALNKSMGGGSTPHADSVQRGLLIQGVAATIRAHAEQRSSRLS